MERFAQAAEKMVARGKETADSSGLKPIVAASNLRKPGLLPSWLLCAFREDGVPPNP